jgi:hypothetical protein
MTRSRSLLFPRGCYALQGQTSLEAQKGVTILRTAVAKYQSQGSYPKMLIGQSHRGVTQVQLTDFGTRVFYTAPSSFNSPAA